MSSKTQQIKNSLKLIQSKKLTKNQLCLNSASVDRQKGSFSINDKKTQIKEVLKHDVSRIGTVGPVGTDLRLLIHPCEYGEEKLVVKTEKSDFGFSNKNPHRKPSNCNETENSSIINPSNECSVNNTKLNKIEDKAENGNENSDFYYNKNFYRKPPGYHESLSEFQKLNINKYLIDALLKQGIFCLTEIQKRSIPIISSGKDCVLQFPVGSGKTLTYLIPLIQKIYELHEYKEKSRNNKVCYNNPLSHIRPWVILLNRRDLCSQVVANNDNIKHL